MSRRPAAPWRWAGLLAGVLLMGASTQVVSRLDSEMRDAMGGFAASLATLLDASTRDSLATTAQQRDAINDALTVIEDTAGLMVEHLERDDVAFMAAALEAQARSLRFAARSGDAAVFNQVLDRSIGTCVGCHARTSEASGTRLAAQLLPPAMEARLPAPRRARLQLATRRFEAARDTLETALGKLTGTELVDALEDYLALMLRILPDPARALEQMVAIQERDGGGPQLAAWRTSLEYWTRHGGGTAELSRARQALSRSRAHAEPGLARIEVLMAVNEAERWLDRGIGGDSDAAEAYLILGSGEHALTSSAWLPLPELYLEQAIWLAPGSATAREALKILQQVLQQRFAAKGLPEQVAAHLQALQRVAGQAQDR